MVARKQGAPAVCSPGSEIEEESGGGRRRKRQGLLEAASRAFADQDYHKVCTEHIASAAGVGKGTLFRYFASKEDLFVATLVYSVEVATAEIDRALAGLTEPLERLETVCENLVAFYRENGHLFHLLHHHKALHEQAGHREFHAKQNLLRGKIAEIISAGRRAGRLRDVDPTIAGRMLFGMLRAALRSGELKDRSPHEVARVILDLFIRGAGRCRKEPAGVGPHPQASRPETSTGPSRADSGE